MADAHLNKSPQVRDASWVGLTLIVLLGFGTIGIANSVDQFVRLAVTVGAAYLASVMFMQRHHGRMVLAACIALLFNPIFPVDLDNNSWPVIYTITVLLVVGLVWFDFFSRRIVALGQEKLRRIGFAALGTVAVSLVAFGGLQILRQRELAAQQERNAARANSEAEKAVGQRSILRAAVSSYRQCRQNRACGDWRLVTALCGAEELRLRSVDSAAFDAERDDERRRAPLFEPILPSYPDLSCRTSLSPQQITDARKKAEDSDTAELAARYARSKSSEGQGKLYDDIRQMDETRARERLQAAGTP